MNKVLVLLSAYNGENFIEAQLESLISQEAVKVDILIRDDGSRDHTCEIVERYAQQSNCITLIKGHNIGCVGSFSELSREAYYRHPEYDYYAFCDQDDVWMNDKLKRACVALNQAQGSSYKLYASAYQMVDCDLDPIPTTMIPSNHSFGESLVIQPTIGCTMVFSRDLLQLFIKGKPDEMLMHDSWIYKMCLGVGGIYVYDSQPSILYRQHGNNVKGGDQTFCQRWIQRWDNLRHSRKSRSIQASYLLHTYNEMLTKENKLLLEDFVACNHSLFKRLKVAFSVKYKSVKFTNDILFRIAVLLNKA